MKRNKWQGVACLLLSSLMIATPMVATSATETKPAETTKETTSTTETKAPSTTPGDNTKPAAPPTTSTTPGENTKPAVPPTTSTTPGENTKPAAPPTTTAPSVKPSTPSDTNAQKPFTLDHFKMIVETLKKLGVDEDEIVTYIKDGKKLEDILKEEKIKPKKFKKAMIKEYNSAVDEAAEKGQITEEQAKQLKAAIKETVKNWLPNK